MNSMRIFSMTKSAEDLSSEAHRKRNGVAHGVEYFRKGHGLLACILSGSIPYCNIFAVLQVLYSAFLFMLMLRMCLEIQNIHGEQCLQNLTRTMNRMQYLGVFSRRNSIFKTLKEVEAFPGYVLYQEKVLDCNAVILDNAVEQVQYTTAWTVSLAHKELNHCYGYFSR